MSAIVAVLITFLLFGYANGRVSKRFPDDFKFGVGVAAYQIEGAWNTSGKGENVWDRFTHEKPWKIYNHDNGDVACDSYRLYKRDVQMVTELSADFYRFSISWARILPDGLVHSINPDGIRYYNDLINECMLRRVEPYVTLFHWDLPQKLQDLGGWTNPLIVDYFAEYAALAFERFGDRVKTWTTINEPQLFCAEALAAEELYAPGYSFPGFAEYLCVRHVQLAHAKAWDVYDKKFRRQQKGEVGITIYAPWVEPESDSAEDVARQQMALQFTMGWQAHPIFSKQGDYPKIMSDIVSQKSSKQGFSNSRLPAFSKDEVDFIKGKSDFFGLNYYFSVKYSRRPAKSPTPSKDDDLGFERYYDPSWPGTAAVWLKIFAPGLKNMLNWLRTEYDNPKVYITENGYPTLGGMNDTNRVEYYQDHLEQVLMAIDDGCNVKAYTAWTLMDNFEWGDGYKTRFGLYEVDFKSENRTRKPRLSAYVYKEIIESRKIDTDFMPNVTFPKELSGAGVYVKCSIATIFFSLLINML